MRWRIAGVVVATLLVLMSAGRAGTLDPQSIQEHTLPNGLKVIVREAHGADLVALQYWVRAGAYTDTAETSGTAHFIEHLWFKGTARRPAGDVDLEIEDLGSELEAITEKDWTLLRTTVASEFAEKALDVIADVVQHPRFLLGDVEAERRVILQEIAAQRRDPNRRVLTERLYAAAFRTHPYRLPVTGTPETVRFIRQAQIKEYYAKHYRLSNAILVIVGDVQPAEILAQVKKLFAAPGPPASRPPLPPAETPGKSPATRRQVVETPFSAGYFGVAYPAPAIDAPEDVYAMDVLVTLLEQAPWGRLPAALRGEATAVSADYPTLRQTGLLTITVQATPEKLEAVERIVLAEVAKLRENPPSPSELEGTKRILTGLYVVDNETFEGQAYSLGYYAAIDRWQFASTYLQNVRQVTAEQVREVAVRYLAPDSAVSIVMKPQAEGEGRRAKGEGEGTGRSVERWSGR